ncbi:hypothetical protein FACS189475_05220 [Betaproteobacteria bacterium]|nr:hypothetical protein FACS189475_05220 [Betaproteobacteria bacterium]
MKMKMLSALLLALSFSTAASAAMCFQIFTPANELVWQGKTPPVPLDIPNINDEVQKMVPTGHLVIIDDRTAPCQAINRTRGATRSTERKLPRDEQD